MITSDHRTAETLDMSSKALPGVAAVVATAPATDSNLAPSNVVSTGPEAFGAKSTGSSDTGWLIGLAVVAALAILGVLLWFRHSAGPNERIRRGGSDTGTPTSESSLD